MVEWL